MITEQKRRMCGQCTCNRLMDLVMSSSRWRWGFVSKAFLPVVSAWFWSQCRCCCTFMFHLNVGTVQTLSLAGTGFFCVYMRVRINVCDRMIGWTPNEAHTDSEVWLENKRSFQFDQQQLVLLVVVCLSFWLTSFHQGSCFEYVNKRFMCPHRPCSPSHPPGSHTRLLLKLIQLCSWAEVGRDLRLSLIMINMSQCWVCVQRLASDSHVPSSSYSWPPAQRLVWCPNAWTHSDISPWWCCALW